MDRTRFPVEGLSYEYLPRVSGKTFAEPANNSQGLGLHQVWLTYDFDPVHGHGGTVAELPLCRRPRGIRSQSCINRFTNVVGFAGRARALILLIGYGTYRAVRPNPNMKKIRQLQTEFSSAQAKDWTPEQRREKFQEMRSTMEKLTPAQRDELSAEQMKREEARLKEYAHMSPADKAKHLDGRSTEWRRCGSNSPNEMRMATVNGRKANPLRLWRRWSTWTGRAGWSGRQSTEPIAGRARRRQKAPRQNHAGTSSATGFVPQRHGNAAQTAGLKM